MANNLSSSAKSNKYGLIQPLFFRNFRLLWFGSVLSFVGAQLTLIAFPWLVLKLTGDSLAMGGVLAVAGIPRAAFMLFGGAFTDRFSARAVMLWTNWLRLLLTLVLTALVYTLTIEMWMVFLIAFLFGIADAFYWPASSVIIPKLLPVELLPAGNSLLQGLGQLSMMMGPILAGVIIASFSAGSDETTADLLGISMIFLIDSIGFVLSLAALTLIRLEHDSSGSGSFTLAFVMTSIKEGFSATWNDLPVRMIAIVLGIFSLFFRGPYLIGIPLLADQRFEQGALAYGMITSAFGVGALIGLLIAGSVRRPADRFLGSLIMVDILVLGAGFIVYAMTSRVEIAMTASLLGGITDGYMVIILISWIHARVPGHLLGRVISVIMLANIGLTPISAGAAGALIRWSLNGVFVGFGSILIGLTLIGLATPVVRNLGMEEK